MRTFNAETLLNSMHRFVMRTSLHVHPQLVLQELELLNVTLIHTYTSKLVHYKIILSSFSFWRIIIYQNDMETNSYFSINWSIYLQKCIYSTVCMKYRNKPFYLVSFSPFHLVFTRHISSSLKLLIYSQKKIFLSMWGKKNQLLLNILWILLFILL